MFSRHSPLKRKHNEYHDPDYPQEDQQNDEDDGKPGCSKYFTNKRRKSEETVKTEKESFGDEYFYKVKQVIEREFQKEIVFKHQQLKEIDERLDKAKHLLDRLRYAIVSEYYKKQEIPLTYADAATLRGPNYLFEREDKGPQMPIHPSLKKLIGKRPKDFSEVIRSCPKRTAAQNAVQTIRAKSQSQKREEKKLKQIIREQGIVIDHSKQGGVENDVNSLLNAAAQNSLTNSNTSNCTSIKEEKTQKELPNTTSAEALNSSRLNNKIKHLIVVGNTSKYIGNEVERDSKATLQNLTHKWLVYVQSKENKVPIKCFVKKVRFYLHHSYRPNDVVDVESPPFQVSRRGWGEFPIRVQLFFHPEYHQKPVQLVHNIILDQTLSGIQTLGAETVLEIWLREVKSLQSPSNLKEEKRDDKSIQKEEMPTKLKTNIPTRSEELVDDNLLEFLNKIESSPCSISADIEKIQPTVVVTEPLAVKLKTPSPEKNKIIVHNQQKSPVEKAISIETPEIPNKIVPVTSTTINNTSTSAPMVTSTVANAQFNKSIFTNSSLTSKPMTTYVKLPTSSTQIKFINTSPAITNSVSHIPPLRPITSNAATSITQVLPSTSTVQKPTIILNKDGKILMPSASVASAVRRTILPIVSSASANIPPTTLQMPQVTTNLSLSTIPQSVSAPLFTSSAPKQILQKKLVQLVDSTGKVKYIQMLVATSLASSSSSAAPHPTTMTTSVVKNNAVTKTTQIMNVVTTPVLKCANGANLTPVATIKPNIFKIVPESIQTKPQILTFSTISAATTNTNTPTTTNTQQAVTTTTTTSAVEPITTPSTLNTTNSNNTSLCSVPPLPPLTVVNKIQKTNGNTTTKNLVFQKEGKLYIIDPQQMKYKQQQKKQVSLLKPQISLLKQQQQQQQKQTLSQTTTAAATVSVSTTPMKSTVDIKSKIAQLSINNAPQIHFGLKQQRINSINALQLMQMKRVLFEKQFLKQEFTNMRSAVEFLLRRLKLIVPKESSVSAFPFTCHTLQEFHSLTAFKQRAFEWLRAKNISRMIRNHKDLQRINLSAKEVFWSTKEIATFARQYAYTPPIKCLPRPDDKPDEKDNNTQDFTQLVKSELKQDYNLQYYTLTDKLKVQNWVDKVWQTLIDYEHYEDDQQIIDIDTIEEEQTIDKKSQSNLNIAAKYLSSSSSHIYLTAPPHLENQCELVSDFCKNFSVKLTHEELDSDVYHPSTLTVLAQCLHLFIEKILRQSIALKREKQSSLGQDSICTILPQDLAKALVTNVEFDFLTNNNLGSTSLAESLASPIKQENS